MIEDKEDFGETYRIFPWVVFKLNQNYCALNSKSIITIVESPMEITKVPNNDIIYGIMNLRDSVIPLISLRRLLHINTMQEEYDKFRDMVDDRKNDHIMWVDELELSVKEDRKFTLPNNPHMCKLGKWYDNFTTDNGSINHVLNLIEEPHRKLHEASESLEKCNKNHAVCKRNECLKITLEKAKNEYMPQVLNLLDEMKKAFKDHYKDMIIILQDNNATIGVIVDEVLSVEEVTPISGSDNVIGLTNSPYIKCIAKGEKIKNNILLINDVKIFEIINTNFQGETYL